MLSISRTEKMLRFLIVLCIFVLNVHSFDDSCPDIPSMSSFNVSTFLERWYELERYPSIFETFQRCINFKYELNTNGTYTVHYSSYTFFDYQLKMSAIVRTNPLNPSNIIIDSFTGFADINGFYVVDTDYDNYALAYSCYTTPLLDIRMENAWIFGRSKNLSSIPSSKIAELKQLLSSKGSETDLFSKTDQDCTFDY